MVFALGSGSSWGDNEELRYALRALARNFVDLGRVIVVGERPRWLSHEAVYIPAKDPFPDKKDANIIRKLLLACQHAVTTPWFVRSSDDEIFLRPTRFADMRGYFAGDLRGARGAMPSVWHSRLRSTGHYLVAQERRARFFDCHAPVPMNREHFIRVMKVSPYRSGCGLAVDSLYFNSDRTAPRAPLRGEVVRLHAPSASLAELAALPTCVRFLNYGDAALDATLKQFLDMTFAEPSRFER